MDSSLPGSSTHGILQPRTLEWVAISFSRGSSNSGIKPTSLTTPALWGRFFTTSTIWESHTHTHTHTHTHVCVCVCRPMCATAWADAWETSCESQQRLRYEAISKEGHGTYYCCLHGLHIRSNPNLWLQLDATGHTPIHARSPRRSQLFVLQPHTMASTAALLWGQKSFSSKDASE